MSRPQAAIVHGDSLAVLKALPSGSVDAVTTSPPYWGVRDYGYTEQLGGEALHYYVDRLAEIMDEVARVMTPSGIAWLNLGDTAVGSGGAGGDYNAGGSYDGRARYRQGPATISVVDPGTLEGWRLVKLAPGQWADVPSRVVHELQNRGWLLRSRVVWAKVDPAREDIGHVRRPKAQHEMVFMLTRCQAGATRFDTGTHPAPQRIGDVWRMDVARGLEAIGQAPWPSQLPQRMLALSGPPGVVLDPFVGYGNTVVGAEAQGWHTLGVDLDLAACEACPGGVVSAGDAAAWLNGLTDWRTDQWAKAQREAEARRCAT